MKESPVFRSLDVDPQKVAHVKWSVVFFEGKYFIISYKDS